MIGYYCLSYKHLRKAEMQAVFNKHNISASISAGVEDNDTRLPRNDNLKRIWSTCYGHLDMIHMFQQSDNEYGIFCEDDIILAKDFTKLLPEIIKCFNKLNLDILMLGYLCENKIDAYSNFPTLLTMGEFKYLGYPEGLWGTQMYLISKAQASRILSKYYEGYAERTLQDKTLSPFASDWTITKEGRRALLYPLIVVEKVATYDDENQQRSHANCYAFSYDKERFE